METLHLTPAQKGKSRYVHHLEFKDGKIVRSHFEKVGRRNVKRDLTRLFKQMQPSESAANVILKSVRKKLGLGKVK